MRDFLLLSRQARRHCWRSACAFQRHVPYLFPCTSSRADVTAPCCSLLATPAPRRLCGTCHATRRHPTCAGANSSRMRWWLPWASAGPLASAWPSCWATWVSCTSSPSWACSWQQGASGAEPALARDGGAQRPRPAVCCTVRSRLGCVAATTRRQLSLAGVQQAQQWCVHRAAQSAARGARCGCGCLAWIAASAGACWCVHEGRQWCVQCLPLRPYAGCAS